MNKRIDNSTLQAVNTLRSARREAVKKVNANYRKRIEAIQNQCDHQYGEWNLCPYTGLFQTQLEESHCTQCGHRKTRRQLND